MMPKRWQMQEAERLFAQLGNDGLTRSYPVSDEELASGSTVTIEVLSTPIVSADGIRQSWPQPGTILEFEYRLRELYHLERDPDPPGITDAGPATPTQAG